MHRRRLNKYSLSALVSQYNHEDATYMQRVLIWISEQCVWMYSCFKSLFFLSVTIKHAAALQMFRWFKIGVTAAATIEKRKKIGCKVNRIWIFFHCLNNRKLCREYSAEHRRAVSLHRCCMMGMNVVGQDPGERRGCKTTVDFYICLASLLCKEL